MVKDHVFLLGKVFSKDIYADDFISKGRFICNTLNYFKNYEDKEKNNIGDILEGVRSRISSDSGVTLKVNGNDIDYKELCFHSNEHLNKNAFCLYGPNIKENKNTTAEAIADLIAIQEDARGLGEYLVVIHNPREFIRRMNDKLNTLGFNFRSQCVEYRELKGTFEIPPHQIGFVKASEYSHQKEFRYLIDTGRDIDESIFIEIGSISDIAFKIQVEEFNRCFEIKLAGDILGGV